MLLGFDIGGSKCSVILGHKTRYTEITLLDKVVLPTYKSVYAMIELLFQSAEALLKKHNSSKNQILGIGISCGGPLNSQKGMILSPPNLPGWDNIPIVNMTSERFGNKAVLQNDANACAVAEWKYGIGVGYRNIIFLTFGTGMGAGLILNGKLYSGSSDAAGEVGHVRMAETGPVGFGKAGSFEGFCSGGGIAQLAQIKTREQLQMGSTTSFCNRYEEIPFLNAKIIADAAFAGDPVAIDIYKTSAQYLAKGLSIMIDILNPELIILGGIYGRAQKLIEPYFSEILHREVLPLSLASCQIVPAMLGEQIGDYAALALADME